MVTFDVFARAIEKLTGDIFYENEGIFYRSNEASCHNWCSHSARFIHLIFQVCFLSRKNKFNKVLSGRIKKDKSWRLGLPLNSIYVSNFLSLVLAAKKYNLLLKFFIFTYKTIYISEVSSFIFNDKKLYLFNEEGN